VSAPFYSKSGFMLGVGNLLAKYARKRPLLAQKLEQAAWAHCPEVPASVESVSVSSSGEGRHPHVGCVVYTYHIDGQTYSGMHSRSFASNQEAWEFVGDCRARAVSARYRPGHPAESGLWLRSLRVGHDEAA
jgi:hypothetical protein